MKVTRQMVFPLAFYKKAKFNGSRDGMNYRIEKMTEDEKDQFLLTVWKGPFCYDATKEEKVTSVHSFDEDGMEEILERINAL